MASSAPPTGRDARPPRGAQRNTLLGAWGSELRLTERAEALAALGLQMGEAPQKTADLDNVRTVRATRHVWRLPPDAGLPPAPALLSRWRTWQQREGPIALLVAADPSLSDAQRLAVARLLRTLPGVVGATVEAGEGWPAELDWPLPFTIGVLREDQAWAALAQVVEWTRARAQWPFRFQLASRRHERQQVLASSLDLSSFFLQLEALPLKLRSHLVIVNGWGELAPDAGLALLPKLAQRLSASGVAVLRKALPPAEFAERLNAFAYELSHDWPLDAALQHPNAFGPDAIFAGTRALLRAARAGTQLEQLADRLRSLPPTTPIALDDQAKAQILVPELAGAPHDEAMPAELVASQLTAATARMRFDHEAQESGALAQLTQAVRRSSAEQAAAAQAARHIQQQSFQRPSPETWVRARDGYVRGLPTQLRVRIGSLADAEWQSSDAAFPDDKLPPNQAQHHLSVVFHEPTQFTQPLPPARIVLPRTGDSSEAVFEFTPRVLGAFEGRITVLHRGRVLQTALLRTRVRASRQAAPTDGDGFVLVDETRVRHDWTSLDQRQRFDLALVCNHDAQHVPRMTAVDERQAWAADLDGIRPAVATINQLLSAVADNVKDHADGLDQGENPALLVALAFAGAELHERLVRAQLAPNAADGLRLDEVEYIQIVGTRIDAVVPVEFIYDRALPAVGDDPVPCPSYRDALRTGRCDPACPGSQKPEQHVCPLGFWGLSKVIERHVFDAQASRGAPLVVRSETSSARKRLAVSSGAMLGCSERVKDQALDALRQLLLPRVPLYEVKTWLDWAKAIGQHAPPWLIAFPHNEGSGPMRRLELGKGMLRTTALAAARAGAPSYVRRANDVAPLVFLLGCDTAGTAEQYGSHVSAFRDAGAAVVVSTIASAFGPHAVSVGTAIARGVLKRLTDAASTVAADGDGEARLGEVLREAKRAALLDSLPMALCVVAFGDADWSL